MKKSVFLYPFIFSSLIALFVYVNSQKVIKKQDIYLKSLNSKLESNQERLDQCEARAFELSYFSLDYHEDALTLFEQQGYKIEELLPRLKDELYETNLTAGSHPLIPYEAEEGRKLVINKSRFLNHKWIIVDFSDGEAFGEALLGFQLNENQTVDFNLIQATLYPNL